MKDAVIVIVAGLVHYGLTKAALVYQTFVVNSEGTDFARRASAELYTVLATPIATRTPTPDLVDYSINSFLWGVSTLILIKQISKALRQREKAP